MSRPRGALTLVAVLATGLALAAPASLGAPPAPPSAASAVKKKRCGHRYRHRPAQTCPSRRGPRPAPPKAKPKPKPSPTAPSGTKGGGSGGGGAATPAPITPSAPGGNASPDVSGSPPAAALPRRLGVDETEYSVTPSYNRVAAGELEFNVTNFGMDDHNLAIRSPGGRLAEVVEVSPGQSRSFSVNLPAGTYTLLCSLYDHEQLGMRATLRVE